MTMQVSNIAHAGPKRGRRKAAPAVAAPQWTPVKLAGSALVGSAVLPATAASPAPAAGATPDAIKPTETAPAEVVKSPEYDPLDPGAVFGDISGGVTSDMVGGPVQQGVNHLLNADRIPYLGTRYGSAIPGKVGGVLSGEIGSIVGGLVTGLAHGVLKHKDDDGNPDGGLKFAVTAPNKLIAKLVKGVGTSWLKMAIVDSMASAPTPVPMPNPNPGVVRVVQRGVAPSDTPGSDVPAPDAPVPPTPIPAAPPRLVAVPGIKKLQIDMGHPATDSSNPPPPPLEGASIEIGAKPALPQISPLLQAGAQGLIGVGISALYDQTVGPLVQRAANIVTGHGSDPVASPKPLTPGRVVNGFVDGVLGGLLVRSVTDIALPGGKTSVGLGLGSSIVNNIVGAAWSTVYNRGLGNAIEKGVNQVAGIRSKEEQEKDVLTAGEHFARAATRGVAAGATTFLVGRALWAPIMQLGLSVGGVGGLLIAAAGSQLIGAVSGGLVDATVGPMLGKLGGTIYSWITGKPSYEQRMAEAPAKPAEPGLPGSPVEAPNGNPGTVPVPPAAAAPKSAPAAPAAGKPKKRKLTGNKAVDATSPAAKLGAARLAQIALKAG